jgi:hypothetical protein
MVAVTDEKHAHSSVNDYEIHTNAPPPQIMLHHDAIAPEAVGEFIRKCH